MATKKKPTDPPLFARLTPGEFRAEYIRKGWSNASLSLHWNITPNWLSKLTGNEERPAMWDDAVRGLLMYRAGPASDSKEA